MHITIGSLNAVDIFMAIVIAAIIYSGKKGGIVSEFVKLLGIFFTTFITLHYYVRFADFLRYQFFGEKAETEFFAFCLLSFSIFITFLIVSRGWSLIFKVDPASFINRGGSFILSLVRAYFLCGMIFLILLLSDHGYATPRTKESVSSLMFQRASANFYEKIYYKFVNPFFPDEEINKHVFSLVPDESANQQL